MRANGLEDDPGVGEGRAWGLAKGLGLGPGAAEEGTLSNEHSRMSKGSARGGD